MACDGMGRLIRLLEYSMRCCNNGAAPTLVRFCLFYVDDAKKARNLLQQERAHLHFDTTFAGVFLIFFLFSFLMKKDRKWVERAI
jgi:hypothetical protein